MNKKDFLKLSYQLDKSGKFEEADELFDKLQKFSQAKPPQGTGKTYKVDKGTAYVNQDPDIAKFNLGTGISPFDWFRGINIQSGSAFDREDYLPGSYNELLTFKRYFMQKWPGIKYVDGEPQYERIPKKDEFYACLLKAQSELEYISRNAGITLTFAVDNAIKSFFSEEEAAEYGFTFKNYFTEFARWVEAQARIYSKEIRFKNYILNLRMAETVLASQLVPQIKTPNETKRPTTTAPSTTAPSTTAKPDVAPKPAETPKPAPKPERTQVSPTRQKPPKITTPSKPGTISVDGYDFK